MYDGWTPEETHDLRVENSKGYAEHGINHGCLFDDTTDDMIEEGFNCGGCACHLSAPCRHCLRHLEPEESWFIGSMLKLTGRATGTGGA